MTRQFPPPTKKMKCAWIHCGREFQPRTRRDKFCSRACRDANQAAKKDRVRGQRAVAV